MRLDHLSYAAGPEGLAACVQRLGSHLGAAFIDGGLHPRFGTRNFILPMSDGVYLEVVGALEHPAVETAPFGRAVRARSQAGGGWLSWVIGTDDIGEVEQLLGRSSVAGHRVRPDGFDLHWRQIGINSVIDDRQLPWFMQWECPAEQHPAAGGGTVKLASLDIAGSAARVASYLDDQATAVLSTVPIRWQDPDDNGGDTGIVAVDFVTSWGTITID